jgi:hypothetical protein
MEYWHGPEDRPCGGQLRTEFAQEKRKPHTSEGRKLYRLCRRARSCQAPACAGRGFREATQAAKERKHLAQGLHSALTSERQSRENQEEYRQ